MEHDKLKALVVAAVHLAIVRNDLATDDCPTIGDDDAEVIANDTWQALKGIGTCSGEVSPELACLLYAGRPCNALHPGDPSMCDASGDACVCSTDPD